MEGLAQLGNGDFRCCKEVFEATASFPSGDPRQGNMCGSKDHSDEVKGSAVLVEGGVGTRSALRCPPRENLRN